MIKKNSVFTLIVSIFLILTVISPSFLVGITKSDSTLDGTSLNTNIENPTDSYINSLTNISGNSTDETQVNNVKLRIHDQSNNLYWNFSTGWRSTEQWFNTTVLDGSWDENSEDWYYALSQDEVDGLDQHQSIYSSLDQTRTSNGNNWWAQGFKPKIETLSKVKLYLVKEGNPPNDITLTICDNTSGEPDENQAIVVMSKSAEEIGTSHSWIEFNFTDVSVTRGATYYILVNTSGGDNSNEYGLAWKEENPYIDGKSWSGLWRKKFAGCFSSI